MGLTGESAERGRRSDVTPRPTCHRLTPPHWLGETTETGFDISWRRYYTCNTQPGSIHIRIIEFTKTGLTLVVCDKDIEDTIEFMSSYRTMKFNIITSSSSHILQFISLSSKKIKRFKQKLKIQLCFHFRLLAGGLLAMALKRRAIRSG